MNASRVGVCAAPGSSSNRVDALKCKLRKSVLGRRSKYLRPMRLQCLAGLMVHRGIGRRERPAYSAAEALSEASIGSGANQTSAPTTVETKANVAESQPGRRSIPARGCCCAVPGTRRRGNIHRARGAVAKVRHCGRLHPVHESSGRVNKVNEVNTRQTGCVRQAQLPACSQAGRGSNQNSGRSDGRRGGFRKATAVAAHLPSKALFHSPPFCGGDSTSVITGNDQTSRLARCRACVLAASKRADAVSLQTPRLPINRSSSY